jgi:hypothetical protein
MKQNTHTEKEVRMSEPIKPLSEAIAAGNQALMREFAAGNAPDLATLYSRDGKLLPNHSGLVEGRLAIQNFWQSVMNLGARHASLQTLELKAFCDWEGRTASSTHLRVFGVKCLSSLNVTGPGFQCEPAGCTCQFTLRLWPRPCSP